MNDMDTASTDKLMHVMGDVVLPTRRSGVTQLKELSAIHEAWHLLSPTDQGRVLDVAGRARRKLDYEIDKARKNKKGEQE